MIKLDIDASEGESLDSQVILAMQEANRQQQAAMAAAMKYREHPSRSSQ